MQTPMCMGSSSVVSCTAVEGSLAAYRGKVQCPAGSSPATLEAGSRRPAAAKARLRAGGAHHAMSTVLGRWGRQVHRLRWWLFGLSVLSLAPAVIVLAQGARFEAGTVLATTQSGRAADLMARQLPGQPVSFDLILSSPTLRATDRAFREEVALALAPLKADARVARIRTAYDVEPPDPAYLSRDSRRVRAGVRSGTLDVVAAGMVPLNHDFVEVAKRDLARAELVILPVVALFLLLAFGSVVAALLPLGVGLLAMVSGMAGTNLLARYMSVSAYAP